MNKEQNVSDNKKNSWILRFVKGIFIGSGFILPGVSGGAMAAVFGIYERLIGFIANITKDFKENFWFFVPVGFGGLFGIFLLSFVVSFFIENYEVEVLWFFIGCIAGTLPSLWKEAGKKGRTKQHLSIMVIVGIVAFVGLLYLNLATADVSNASTQQFPFWAWILAGGLIGLGVLVPGLSPSNFLIFFGMYGSMSAGFKTLDLSVVIPLFIGVGICVLSLSKVANYLLAKYYATMFHVILGVVLASTVMIVPLNYNYLSLGSLVCLATFILGYLLASWMSQLEEKYIVEEVTE